MMDEKERLFIEDSYLTARDENMREGGLLFPFLTTKKWNPNRIIRAIVIPARKSTTACFACVGYKKNYNGIFFSVSPELEEEEKELVEVVHYRILADIQRLTDGDCLRIKIKPDATALETFFETQQAVYISKKEHLEFDSEIPF